MFELALILVSLYIHVTAFCRSVTIYSGYEFFNFLEESVICTGQLSLKWTPSELALSVCLREASAILYTDRESN